MGFVFVKRKEVATHRQPLFYIQKFTIYYKQKSEYLQ